jgi:hypothetical protein
MKDPTAISLDLMKPFPADVIDEKNGLLYVPHEIVRDRLISATENQFDWSIDQVLFRDDGVTRRANDRATGEIRRPLSMIVIGTLAIPGLGSRAGIGAHPLDEGAGEDAAYKSAESDAIKRAAMSFGVGLNQLYIETGEAKRAKKPGRNTGATGRTTQRPQTRQHQPTQAREPLTDAEFDERVRQAVGGKNAQQMMELVDDAQDLTGRWCVLVNATESIQALAWVAAKYKHAGLSAEAVLRAIEKRREVLSDPNYGRVA